jgi:hypothetical protein
LCSLSEFSGFYDNLQSWMTAYLLRACC